MCVNVHIYNLINNYADIFFKSILIYLSYFWGFSDLFVLCDSKLYATVYFSFRLKDTKYFFPAVRVFFSPGEFFFTWIEGQRMLFTVHIVKHTEAMWLWFWAIWIILTSTWLDWQRWQCWPDLLNCCSDCGSFQSVEVDLYQALPVFFWPPQGSEYHPNAVSISFHVIVIVSKIDVDALILWHGVEKSSQHWGERKEGAAERKINGRRGERACEDQD